MDFFYEAFMTLENLRIPLDSFEDIFYGPPWTFFQPSFMLSYISFLLSCVRILLNGKKFITRTPYFSVPCIEADKVNGQKLQLEGRHGWNFKMDINGPQLYSGHMD